MQTCSRFKKRSRRALPACTAILSYGECARACVCAVCKPCFLFTLCSNGFWLQCMFMYINILLLYSRPIFGLLGLTVKQNWVEVMDWNINIWKTLRKWVKKIIIKNKKKRKEMSYSMTHYSTAIFGSQKPLGRTNGYQERTAREKRVCSSSAHCRDYLHLCFKTLDAELD